MLTTPKTSTETATPETIKPIAPAPRTNGLNQEQLQAMIAAAGRYKEDTGFLQRWEEGIAEYRRVIQEELEHDLEEAEGK